MITQTLKIWQKPAKVYPAPVPYQPPVTSYGTSVVTQNGEFVHWSNGKDAIQKRIVDIAKELNYLWKDNTWLVPGIRVRPRDKNNQTKWGNEALVLQTARTFVEFNGDFTLPTTDKEHLFPVFVKVLQPGRKDTGTIYRCQPDFLEPIPVETN